MTDPVARLAELVTDATGIRVDSGQHPGLLAALERAHPDVDAARFLQLVRDHVSGPSAVASLIDEVTIKETFFLRDRTQLDSIDWHALHERAQADGRTTIRVWSAACATGEEPYSLALLAAEAFASAEPPIQILATDISGAALAAARDGAYRERSTRALSDELRGRYFESDGNRHAVSDRLRRGVGFALHNLVRDPFPPVGEAPFDLVVCRNVLIYFDPATVERLLASFEHALAPRGELIVGAADALCGAAVRLARLATEPSPSRRSRAKLRILRRPLGRAADQVIEDRLAAALRAADEGRTDDALSLASGLAGDESLEPQHHFVRGLVELESGDADAAVHSLRRALYLDPDFGVAAFTLGRAHESRGDATAARRSYRQALRALRTEDERHDDIVAQVDHADVAAACEARLAVLALETRP